jgi:small GTP-binding protein
MPKTILDFYDTAGQADYDRLRPLTYPGTDVVIICFSITEPASFTNVSERWAPEIRHFLPVVPIILVGCKSDLRNDPEIKRQLQVRREAPTQFCEGLSLKDKIKAVAYVECSAWKGEGLDNVFQKVIWAVNEKPAMSVSKTPRRKKIFCNII